MNFNDMLQNMGGAFPGIDIKRLFAALPEKSIESSSAGNMVSIKMTTRFEIEDITVDPGLLNEEKRYLLEEMMASTFQDLTDKVIDEAQRFMQKQLKESVEAGGNSQGAEQKSSNPQDILNNMSGTISMKDANGEQMNINLDELKNNPMTSKILDGLFGGGTPSDDDTKKG